MLMASGMFINGLTSCAGAGAEKTIGLQLYSLRDYVKEFGIQKTLELVAQMGYKTLEAAGYNDGLLYGMKPVELKKMVDDLGMRMTSSHIGKAYNKEQEAEIYSWWDKAVEAHNALGVKYMVLPFMAVNDSTTLDDIKCNCDYLSQVGLRTAAASIGFGYHNHDFEFKKIDDQIIYDFMLNNVSKDHVMFQMDVYWVVRGGYNPVDYMKKYGDQIKLLHIKDEKEIGASGMMDFEAIFNQANAIGIKDWYTEVERYSGKPEDSVKQSFDFLNNAAYVK